MSTTVATTTIAPAATTTVAATVTTMIAESTTTMSTTTPAPGSFNHPDFIPGADLDPTGDEHLIPPPLPSDIYEHFLEDMKTVEQLNLLIAGMVTLVIMLIVVMIGLALVGALKAKNVRRKAEQASDEVDAKFGLIHMTVPDCREWEARQQHDKRDERHKRKKEEEAKRGDVELGENAENKKGKRANKGPRLPTKKKSPGQIAKKPKPAARKAINI